MVWGLDPQMQTGQSYSQFFGHLGLPPGAHMLPTPRKPNVLSDSQTWHRPLDHTAQDRALWKRYLRPEEKETLAWHSPGTTLSLSSWES